MFSPFGVSLIAYLFQAAGNISTTHVAPMFYIMLGIAYAISKRNILPKYE